ncbi:hypothetical protein AA0113_g1101 [Alternaria arborescens]|uniref:Xylanolytic transcriptional activator regulatory domain-containing protein n=2 Tax=Alternaria arborescens TaxID=156630 RepID=A0A4V1X872_9PLEO|nr:hypothetical protein AA0113_g1101 [Alternaria arborescens]
MSQEMGPPSIPDLHSPSLQQSTGSSSLTPLPGDCWRLIEIYCTYTQCWLPIADKLEILKLSYSYPERGLALSCDMSSSGSHAEMWSMFAVGSSQDDNNVTGESYRAWSPIKLYNIARQLIPDELGNFELDHVKALLNLALFNINRRLFDASWHLVGAALRISLMLAETSDVAASRRKHVMSGCFVLDSVLSLHLKRRPYLDRGELSWMGKIEEDGMEEWQPWSGHLNLDPTRRSNSPTLALSTFNALLELVDILGCTSREQTAPNFLHEMIGRLEMWKSALPQRLEYIRKDSAFTPATPPALLLRFTYLVTAFTLVPSQAWLQQILDMLSVLQRQLGATRMPAIIACLLQSIRRSIASLNLDQPTHARIRELFATLGQSSHEPSEGASTGLRSVSISRRDPSSENPGTLQTSPQPLVPQLRGPFVERYQQPPDPSNMVHGRLPDMGSNHQGHSVPPFEPNLFDFGMAGPIFDPHDPYNALVSGDLGSFLDDFASKHGAKKLQNQPQFMENLGFSSEVSMADLLAADPGRFMPTASNMGADNSEESPQFPLNTFYDAG